MADNSGDFGLGKITTHRIIFTRREGIGGDITAHGVCQFRAGPGASLERLKRAITKWIQETEEGRKAWEESGEDFNIGDLVSYSRHDLLVEYGVEALWVTVNEDVVADYDTILCHYGDLEESE